MKKIYTDPNLMNCYMVQTLLRASKIPTFLKNEHTSSIAASELGALIFAWPELWVINDKDLQKAEECIKQSTFDFLKGNEMISDESKNKNSVWICQNCKEEVPSSFELCWNCEADTSKIPEYKNKNFSEAISEFNVELKETKRNFSFIKCFSLLILLSVCLILILIFFKKNDYGIKDYNKGLSYLNDKDYTNAFKYFSKAAELNNSEAQNKLGDMYANGYRVKQNYDEATKWYTKAIEQNQPDAFISLGSIYENGHGNTKKSFKKALLLYESAANVGNTYGQINLGRMYQEGYGVKQNYKKAVQLYKEAVKGDNFEADCFLGYMYEKGFGVEQDDEKAMLCYKKGALSGDLDSINSCAYFYAEKEIYLDNAEELIKVAIQEEPKNGYYLDTFGWILFKKGKYNESLKQLKKAKKLEPNDEVIYNHLGYVYSYLNKKEKATAHWKKALELSKDKKLKKKIEEKLTDNEKD